MYDAGHYDVIVIGAGHAGVEAGLASAKRGAKTLMLTLNLDLIAFMPCNHPSVVPLKVSLFGKLTRSAVRWQK